MTIKYFSRSVYGSKYKYFANPAIGRAFSIATGKATLTPELQAALALAGCSFDYVFDPETVPPAP